MEGHQLSSLYLFVYLHLTKINSQISFIPLFVSEKGSLRCQFPVPSIFSTSAGGKVRQWESELGVPPPHMRGVGLGSHGQDDVPHYPM